MFTNFYPNVIVSIRLCQSPFTFLTAELNGDVRISSSNIKQQEQFQLRKLTKNVVSFKSCSLTRDLVVDERGLVKADVTENIKSSRSGRSLNIPFFH